MIDLKELAKEVHQGNVERGFWEEPRSLKTLLMLVITELSEAVEADRKGKYASRADFDYHARDSMIFVPAFENSIKDTFEDEIADAFIRLLDLAAAYNVKIGVDVSVTWPNDVCDAMFDLSANVIFAADNTDYIDYLICFVQDFCEFKNIDLIWHVTQKIKYNATRPRKHGKKY